MLGEFQFFFMYVRTPVNLWNSTLLFFLFQRRSPYPKLTVKCNIGSSYFPKKDLTGFFITTFLSSLLNLNFGVDFLSSEKFAKLLMDVTKPKSFVWLSPAAELKLNNPVNRTT